MIFIETDFGQCKFATLAASTRLPFAAFHKTLAVVEKHNTKKTDYATEKFYKNSGRYRRHDSRQSVQRIWSKVSVNASRASVVR